ncbi:MAG: hypothetical protein HYU79_06890 [Nitrosomonadales bacterium]|nr:hypothetical protein [Nitrosomonadales bacterium]
MNTKQLIVLWYVGVVVLLLLVADGWGVVWLRRNESATFALAAILFGGLVMFTQRNGLQFDKKLFAKWMSIPAFLLVALIAYVISHESKVAQKVEVLAPWDQANVTGTAGLSYGTLFQGNLYNGTNYYLRSIVINITAKEKDGKIRWSRQFSDDVFIKPLTTGSFQIEVVDAKGAQLDWSVSEVKGEWQGAARK